ncbi:hypothetical protein L1887_08083 [Cichorium endivia]|nr:hypothetical protein L1887_08083 [Cichorium endivia]
MSSVNSPPSPPSPISESIRMHLPNMDRLTGLNYMEGKPDKTIMDMHSMLTLYESFIEKHSSIDSAASGLSPVIGHIKRWSRSSGPVPRCFKLGIHRVGHSHGKIGKCSEAEQFGNSGIS